MIKSMRMRSERNVTHMGREMFKEFWWENQKGKDQ
jgi:hypothetical protein